jgi:LysM repeat protein
MEEEIIKNDKSQALLPAMGLLGLGVGVVALVLGIFAMKKSGDVSASMTDKIEKAAALSLEIKKLGDRVDSLALQLEDLKSGDGNRVENLARQTNDAVRRLGSMISDNRKSIADVNKALEELAKRPAAARRAEAPAAAPQLQPESQTAAGAEGGVHIIQSGDTFAKIAMKYKTTVDALIRANPDLRPSRLMIGQKVVIPQ